MDLPLSNSWARAPTATGQAAVAEAVLEVHTNDGFQKIVVLPNQTRSFKLRDRRRTTIRECCRYLAGK